MKILLLGASGYVGARIFRDLNKKFDIAGTYFSNSLLPELLRLDITQEKQIADTFDEFKPEIIIHVANNPSSKWCEENPEQAVLLNEKSTEYLVNAANIYKSKVIYISTMGAINPASLYQRTKSNSEKTVSQTQAGFLNLRPSVGIGLSPNTTQNNFFNKMLNSIKQKASFEADVSLKFQPVHLNHISQVIESCLVQNIWNLTIPISVPELKSKYDIACDILKEFGIKVVAMDEHRNPFSGVGDIDEQLTKLKLPVWNYSKIISKTVEEIKSSEFI